MLPSFSIVSVTRRRTGLGDAAGWPKATWRERRRKPGPRGTAQPLRSAARSTATRNRRLECSIKKATLLRALAACPDAFAGATLRSKDLPQCEGQCPLYPPCFCQRVRTSLIPLKLRCKQLVHGMHKSAELIDSMSFAARLRRVRAKGELLPPFLRRVLAAGARILPGGWARIRVRPKP